MGTHHADGGYSATVECFFEVDGERLPVAKTNGRQFYLHDQSKVIPPGTKGTLVVLVDGQRSAREVLVTGSVAGVVEYEATPDYSAAVRTLRAACQESLDAHVSMWGKAIRAGSKTGRIMFKLRRARTATHGTERGTKHKGSVCETVE